MARTITFTFLFTALAVAGFYTANRLVERKHVDRLFDENEAVREASARWLVEHRRHGRVPDLIRAIERFEAVFEYDQPAEGLRSAASELARAGHVALFVSLLETETLKGWSLEVLDRFVPLPESALPVLGELLDHEEDDIFAPAASLLCRSGQRAVSTLVRNIRYMDDDGSRRFLLNMMREQMGPVAKAAVPSLREKLEIARSERLFVDFKEEIGFAVEQRYLLSASAAAGTPICARRVFPPKPKLPFIRTQLPPWPGPRQSRRRASAPGPCSAGRATIIERALSSRDSAIA